MGKTKTATKAEDQAELSKELKRRRENPIKVTKPQKPTVTK